MLILLIFSVSFSILISAFCSLMEAALYAVPMSYVRHLSENGAKTSKLLLNMKEQVSKPITAILIFNTVGNTAGAAVAGFAFAEVFGRGYLFFFSLFFTLAILYMSEIFPKMIGVVFCKPLSLVIVYPLKFMIFICSPLIYLSDGITRRISKKAKQEGITVDEILSLTNLSIEQGGLDSFEGSVINNIIGLDGISVKNILTPRVVVFRKDENLTTKEVSKEIADWNYSRIPIFNTDDPDILTGYVMQRDVYREILKDNMDLKLSELARPLVVFPALMSVDSLVLKMFEGKEHMCAVVDEHGGLSGIVTLEDIMEEILGREIVDEYDSVSDLRTFAKILKFAKKRD